MSKVFQMLGGSGGSIKLASIEITTPPTKTAYKAGEQFSTAGMVVKATYSNGATLIATGVSVEPSGGLEAGRTSVTIRYTEGGVSCTATQAVTVTKTNVTVPSQSGSLTYSGSSQSPAWYNYDTAKMTLGGTTSGTNAGTYSAKFTLKDTARSGRERRRQESQRVRGRTQSPVRRETEYGRRRRHSETHLHAVRDANAARIRSGNESPSRSHYEVACGSRNSRVQRFQQL